MRGRWHNSAYEVSSDVTQMNNNYDKATVQSLFKTVVMKVMTLYFNNGCMRRVHLLRFVAQTSELQALQSGTVQPHREEGNR